MLMIPHLSLRSFNVTPQWGEVRWINKEFSPMGERGWGAVPAGCKIGGFPQYHSPSQPPCHHPPYCSSVAAWWPTVWAQVVELDLAAHNAALSFEFRTAETASDSHVLIATAIYGEPTLRLQVSRRPTEICIQQLRRKWRETYFLCVYQDGKETISVIEKI